MSRAVLSNLAASDLQGISDFMAQDSIQPSEAVVDYLIDQLDLIAATPKIGRERPDVWPGMLCFVVGRPQWRSRFLVFYRQTRIIEGHRDIQAALAEPPT